MSPPLPTKLVDSIDHGAGTELLIVEGDSAARAVNRLRESRWQAVLPMQGKPLNAMKAKREDVVNNPELSAVIAALGVQVTDSVNPRDMRYERVVLLFDPDADGIHGRTLMLLFFYRWLRPLLEMGCVFNAHAPQWVIQATELVKPSYAYTETHLARIRRQLTDQKATNVQTKRFRGLGSLDAATLTELCLNVDSRTLEQLSPRHAEDAIEVYNQFGADLSR